MTGKTSNFYVYLAGLALVTAWLANLTDLQEIYHGSAPLHSLDYFSSGYKKWAMDGQGKLKQQVVSETMEHYGDDGTTHMVNPWLFFYNENASPWLIKSATGILSGDGKLLLLNGRVVITRDAAQGVRPLTINTSALRVNPETSYAETKAWAELISPPNTTTGTGMQLTFANPVHLQLLAHVKGKYETK